jgi:hypothetical protein
MVWASQTAQLGIKNSRSKKSVVVALGADRRAGNLRRDADDKRKSADA